MIEHDIDQQPYSHQSLPIIPNPPPEYGRFSCGFVNILGWCEMEGVYCRDLIIMFSWLDAPCSTVSANPQPSPALTQHLGPPWPSQSFQRPLLVRATKGLKRGSNPMGGWAGVSLEAIPIITSTLSTENQKIKNKDENIMTP